MQNAQKYKPLYYLPPECINNWVERDRLEKAPAWCSVDLRDGNQALVTPMSLDEKISYYRFLLGVGFKEIEVGFPAASETEYEFLRTLIDEGMIPDDVTIQVLTQSRPHIIEKTFAALKGAKRAVVHLYNSTSQPQREQVFKMDKGEIIDIARDGARLFNSLAASMPETTFTFEYSPESFTGTEPEFALEICNAVIDIWKPTPNHKVIINLPATVETSMPHVYAWQIAYLDKYLNHRENVIISLHPHNDRGTGVAAAELGLLAGADRVEGTLFGNGERTGNVDILTLALNLYTHGIDPGLNLSDMPGIVKTYEQATGLPVSPRHPYAGRLVFAAFSGSHQDAIAKGMAFRKRQTEDFWTVPYLPLDPADVNREYDADVIRINSQSGKGGIAYILEQKFGYNLPKGFRPEVGHYIKDISDKGHKELSPQEILDAFTAEYVGVQGRLILNDLELTRERGGQNKAQVTITFDGSTSEFTGRGNGPIDAVARALRMVEKSLNFSIDLSHYSQDALEGGSDARAVSYIGLTDGNSSPCWGVGVDSDTTMSAVYALVSAINRQLR